jgi:pimeloyl-ACP methyl ester carboxylesterase
VTFDAYARTALQALDALDVGPVDIVGLRAGGLVGLEMAALRPKSVAHVVLVDAPAYPAELREDLRQHYAPAIEPDWFGGHLLHAWHVTRDQSLFWPWYRRTRAGVLRKPPQLDPGHVHQRAVDLLKSPGRWREAHLAEFDYPLHQRLRESKAALLVAAAPASALFEIAQQAASDSRAVKFLRLPDAVAQWSEALGGFLGA